MAILVTSKYEEDPIKTEGARVATIHELNISWTTSSYTSEEY